MASSRGKLFEDKFKEDWKKSFPDGTIDRLYDTTSGYKSISTVIYSFQCKYIFYPSHLYIKINYYF